MTGQAPWAIWGSGSTFWTAGGPTPQYGVQFQPEVSRFDGTSWVVDTTLGMFITRTLGVYYTSTGTAINGTSSGDLYFADYWGSLFHYKPSH